MTQQIPEVDVSNVPAEIPAALTVLDVREDAEWAAGHIDGAQHIPLMQVPQRIDELSTDTQLLVVCRSGARSAQATAFLNAHGLNAVNLSGGMVAWARSRRSMVADGVAAPEVF